MRICLHILREEATRNKRARIQSRQQDLLETTSGLKEFIKCCTILWLLVYRHYKQYRQHNSVSWATGHGRHWQTVKHRQQTDSYIKAGRKVLYLQDASEKKVYQRALVIFFRLILSLVSFLFVFFFHLLTHTGTHSPSPSEVPRRVSLFSSFFVISLSSFWMYDTQMHQGPSLNRPKHRNLHVTARWSSLWPRTSFPSPSCSGTRWWSAAQTGWSRRRSSSSCPWWWICWLRTLSPVLWAGAWCTVSASSCPGGKASRRAGAPPHLLKKRTKTRGQTGGLRGSCTHLKVSSKV